MPQPRSDETREQFLDRGMGDPEAIRDFPDDAQRFAFLSNQWEERDKEAAHVEDLQVRTLPGRLLKQGPQTLFVGRPLLNAEAVSQWASGQGLMDIPPQEEMHATILHSKAPVDWFGLPVSPFEQIRIPAGGARAIEVFNEGAVVLRFASPQMARRHDELVAHGGSHDFPSFNPHVTVGRVDDPGDELRIEPFRGELLFGPELFQRIKSDRFIEKRGEGDEVEITIRGERVTLRGRVAKVNEDLRVAWGWFSVIELDGVPVVDSQDDVILEHTLLHAVHQFMINSRAGRVMHEGEKVADIVASLVFTKDLQASLGIDLGRVGWFGGMKFHDLQTWLRVKSGELPEFSLGGTGSRRPI